MNFMRTCGMRGSPTAHDYRLIPRLMGSYQEPIWISPDFARVRFMMRPKGIRP